MTQRIDVGEGFVRLVDTMGTDGSIVQAARVSYGEGTTTKRRDEQLIRYLMKHQHTSPFEMVDFKFHIKCPIFVARQWLRHRTACLTGDMKVSFDLPGGVESRGHKHYSMTIKEIFDKFQPTENKNRPDRQGNAYFKRDKIKSMLLRSVNEENGTVYHSNIVDIWSNGVKPVVKVVFEDGSFLRATESHRVFTENGWMTLGEALKNNVKFVKVGKTETTEKVPEPFSEEEVENERWLPIVGYEDLYEVSNLGRVRRTKTKWLNELNPPRMKKITESQGYHVVSLSSGGETTVHHVHKLVLNSFVGPKEAAQECRHLDSVPTNNRLSNLCWGTAFENARDRMDNDGHQRLGTSYISVEYYEDDGEEEVFDIEVAGPFHNFVANNLVVHNSVNEYSLRYSEAIDDFWIPEADRISTQDSKNHQASSGEVHENAESFTEMISNVTGQSNKVYRELIASGVSREVARSILPVSNYTEFYWKIDLHNLLHFINLRSDGHAQPEIQMFSNAIAYFIRENNPVTFESWHDFIWRSVTVSASDLDKNEDPSDLLEYITGRMRDPLTDQLDQISVVQEE